MIVDPTRLKVAKLCLNLQVMWVISVSGYGIRKLEFNFELNLR